MQLYFLVLLAAILPKSFAFFDFGGFHQMHQQQQQQQQQQHQGSYEDSILNNNCEVYVCPATKECVKSPVDCPCEFPKSQMKCVLPDKKNYVCISKPATNDPKLMALYDDPVKGPRQRVQGMRDCGWVEEAYKGLV